MNNYSDSVVIDGIRIPYMLIRTARRTLAVEIRRDAGSRGDEPGMIIRAPRQMPEKEIWQFIKSKERWITDKCKSHPVDKPSGREQIPDYMTDQWLHTEGMERFKSTIEKWAARMGISYGNITIRNQRTRWGSCSSKGNLNFNWRLLMMPQSVMDYVVVHELAHRREMNHSPRFWAIVEQYIPDYKERRRWLRENGERYMKAE